ncbi:unnamed protein product, partial [Schistosoma mattheei]
METLSINMIITFPLDPMHMMYLGVTKKIANLWIDLARRRLRNFNSCAIRDINNLISGCVASTPSDFPRKCRTLDFVSAWKASESFPFESYMRQIKDSVRSGFAVAKQAAQRYAERMSFNDRLQISGLINTTQIGANDVSTKQ